jgi:cell wall-associated NlpC family hydrolase
MSNWITHFCRPARAPWCALSLALVLGCGLALGGAARAQEPAALAETVAVPGAGHDIVLGALAYLGVPYRYGGNDPAKGFDCSGLVRHVFLGAAALELPRSAHEMARQGVPVAAADLQPGDLVFFNTRGRPYSHVGIYIGDGSFVHAPAKRGQVKIESMEPAYWQRRFNGARRIVAAPGVSAPQSLPAVFAPGPVPPESASSDH